MEKGKKLIITWALVACVVRVWGWVDPEAGAMVITPYSLEAPVHAKPFGVTTPRMMNMTPEQCEDIITGIISNPWQWRLMPDPEAGAEEKEK